MDVWERPWPTKASLTSYQAHAIFFNGLNLTESETKPAHAFFGNESSTASMQLEPEALKLIDILNCETKTHLKRCNHNNRLAEVLYKKQLP
jgi:hypothetical protein